MPSISRIRLLIDHKTMFSQEYIGAIVIILISLLKMAGIEIENEVMAGLVTGIVGLWIAIRRKMKGDINGLGIRV